MTTATDFQRIEKAIAFIEGNFTEQPSLSDIARHVNLSEYHFQRLFKRWAGISPKRYLQVITANFAGALMQQQHRLTDVVYEAGLSSPSRLHELMVNIHAMSPAQYRSQGQNLEIEFGVHDSPFGQCLLALTAFGICELQFLPAGKDPFDSLSNHWPTSKIRQNCKKTAPWVRQIFAPAGERKQPLSVHLKGTNFQIKVWQSLLNIPQGTITCYEDVARWCGNADARQAVGQAVGRNPVAYLIPCHRVIKKNGMIGNYRWGSTRKSALLAWEICRNDSDPGKWQT